MARGGARNNAGRPQGGTNKLTQEAVERAKETGVLPHEYLLSIVQNEHEEQALRVHCAIAVAPYYAPKMASVQHSGEIANTPQIATINLLIGDDKE